MAGQTGVIAAVSWTLFVSQAYLLACVGSMYEEGGQVLPCHLRACFCLGRVEV